MLLSPSILFRRSGACLEAVVVVAGLQDVAPMREAIKQCGRHLGITKHARRLVEAQICGYEDAGAFIKSGSRRWMEEDQKTVWGTVFPTTHGAPGGAERQISQLVQYQEAGFHQHLCDLSSLALGLFLLQPNSTVEKKRTRLR